MIRKNYRHNRLGALLPSGETAFQRTMLYAIIILCLIYELIEAIFLRTTDLEKVAFALFCVFMLAVGFARLSSNWSLHSKNIYLKYAVVVGLMFAIYPLFTGIENSYYYLRDLITFCLLLASFSLVGGGSALNKSRTWEVVVYCILFITLIAFIVSFGGSRFEPPELIVIPFLVFLIKTDKNKMHFFVYLTLILACVALAYLSQQRTSLILVAASLFLSFSFYETRKYKRFLYFFAACISVFALAFLFDMNVIFSGTRYEKLLLGSIDGSLLARFHEAADVFYAWLDYGIFEKMFGAGAGALYPIEFVQNDKMLVYTSEGYLRHHVHSTPAGLLLRFGFLGFSVYVVYSVVQIVSVFFGKSYSTVFESFISLSLSLYLISGFLFYIPASPVFWLVLACKLSFYRKTTNS